MNDHSRGPSDNDHDAPATRRRKEALPIQGAGVTGYQIAKALLLENARFMPTIRLTRSATT